MNGEIQQKLGRPNQRGYKVVQRLKNFLEQNQQIKRHRRETEQLPGG